MRQAVVLCYSLIKSIASFARIFVSHQGVGGEQKDRKDAMLFVGEPYYTAKQSVWRSLFAEFRAVCMDCFGAVFYVRALFFASQ